MKRKIFLMGVTVLLIVLVCLFVACEGVKIETDESGNISITPVDDPSGGTTTPADPSELAEYAVTFDANGGALTDNRSVTVVEGNYIVKPSDPVYTGHLFIGWSKNISGSPLWDFNVEKPNSDLTLYAVWEEEITVSFSANGGYFASNESVKTVSVRKGERAMAPEQPTREHYSFTHWYADPELKAIWDFANDTVVTSITLYAGWSYNEVNVTFVLNYDGAQNVVRSTVNGKIDYTPERAGYVFNGWWHSSGLASDGYILSKKHDVNSTVTVNNLVLYAEWVDESTVASQLRAPSISVSDGVLTWDSVPNAQSYTIIVNQSGTGSEMLRTAVTNTAWNFPQEYEAGYYSVRIRANGDGINAVNSVYVSKSYAHKTLPSVSGITLDISTSVLTWMALDKEVEYEVYLNNILADVVKTSLLDLSAYDAGNYLVGIKATYLDYIPSLASANIQKFRLRSPNVEVVLQEDLSYNITWDEVPGADSYLLKINDAEFRQSERAYRLPSNSNLYDENGRVAISVSAFDSTADYLISVNDPEVIKRKPFPLTLDKNVKAAGSIYGPTYAAGVGEEVTLTAKTNLGYVWLGWFDGETKVSEEGKLTYTFTMPAEKKSFTAKWQLAEGMECFEFTSDKESCTVTGLTNAALTSVTIPDCVTSIGYEAFTGCSGLTSVTIGSSVTSIGYEAFYNCYKLVEVYNKSSLNITKGSTNYGYVGYYAKNVYTTEGGNKLSTDENGYVLYTDGEVILLMGYTGSDTELTLPTGITEIYQYAFVDCSALTSVTIPDSVTSIGESAFVGCSGLTSVTIGSGVTSIGQYAFSGCSGLTSVTIGSGVTSIGAWAFVGCSGLTSVTIGSSVTSIGQYAFSGCSGLTSITIPFVGATKDGTSNTHFGYIFGAGSHYGNSSYVPSSLKTVMITGGTSIGSDAFYDCSGLTSVTIGSGVTSIRSYAFSRCGGLTSITIPDSVTSIGRSAFENCRGLVSIYYEGDVAGWCAISSLDYLMIYGSSDKSFYIGGEKVSDLVIPDSVTSIPSYAFRGCSNLTSISIPNSVTSIGSSAFYNCTGLTSVTIGSSVTSIGQYAFYGCSSLESMTIPFVGGSQKTSNDTYQYPFGYIFGTSSYTGGTAVMQYYYGSSTSSTTYSTYYVPSTLRSVTVTGGKILYGSFYNCSMLTSVTIESGVTSIGSYAFYGCSGLTSITIPDSVTSIGRYAFYNCYKLVEVYNKSSLDITKGSTNYDYVGLYAKNVYTTEGGNKLSTDENGYVLYTDGDAIWLMGYTGSDTELTLPAGITEIYQYAFYGCSNLTSISIPNSVTSIGEYAFYYCRGLTSVTIPSSVTSIGEYAFYNCSGLTSISIPNSVTSIGSSAFYNCTGLTSVTIPDSVTSIGESAFVGCSGLTSITIPDSVTSIGNNAFYGCYKLVEVYNKSSLNITKGSTNYGYVGYYAKNVYTTEGGNKLSTDENGYVLYTDGDAIWLMGYTGSDTELTLPAGITEIYQYAFYGCSNLTSISIPNSVTSIGSYAFRGCTGLTSVTIPSSVMSIGQYAFYGCSNLTSISIPDSVTSIGFSAFWNCSGLTSVTIPDSVTSIGGYAFNNCTGLTSVTIGSGVTSIGGHAFSGCSGLTSVTIGSGVTSIEYCAFEDCTKLTSITFQGTRSQWYAISKGSDWDSCTGTYTIRCTNGDIAK